MSASYATFDELAEHLRVSRRTCERLVRKRKIPSVKIGKLRRFNLDAVDRKLSGDA